MFSISTLLKKTNISKLIESMSGTDNSSLKREVLSLKASIQKMRAALVGIEESVDTIPELPNDRPLLQAAMLNDHQPPAKRYQLDW